MNLVRLIIVLMSFSKDLGRHPAFGVLLGSLFCAVPGGHALAQSAVVDSSAQELLRQQERERVLREQQARTADVRLPRAPVPAASEQFPIRESPCFPIRHISLVGNGAERFRFALWPVVDGPDPAIGRCLGAPGINVVLTRVQNALIAKGFVTTRILAAPQDLKRGELVLTVIPGRARAIRFTPGSGRHGLAWNALPLHAGDILNLRDIEQGLENFKRVPSAEADLQIEPAETAGAQPGESDLVIRYQQARPLRLASSVDDSGSRATGKYQGAITLSLDNPLTLNDLFYASFSHDLSGEGSKYGTRGLTLHYSVPFGYWLLSWTSNQYRYYQSVAGANQTYIYSGTSRTSDLTLSRLLYRDAVRKTSVSLRGYLRTSNNFINDTEVEVQRRRMAGWEAGLTHHEYLGAAVIDLNLAYRQGTGALGALPAPEEAFGEGTSRPRLLTAGIAVNAPFTLNGQHLRYGGVWRAQWNETPLVPQDRFAMGGRYTVRGFDGENILAAERGWLVRNDLGLALAGGQEFYLGLDYGEVGGPSAASLAGRRLAGAVLGLRGGYKGFYYDVFAGKPVYKPERFQTANTTVGFNVGWSY